MQSVLSTVAGVLFLAGYFPYIYTLLKGETKPSKASWIIWASLDAIILTGMWTKDTVNGQIIGAALGSGIVMILAFKYGISGWSRLDSICITGAVIGIFLWWVFDNANVGIVTSVTIIIIGSLPTFASTWRHPRRESRTSWFFWFVSCLFALASVPHWTLADAAQPIAFTVVETTMIYMLFRPRPRQESG